MYQIVLCSCPSVDVAKELAHQLIKQKLAACINIIPQITSIYEWDEEVVEDNEVQLIIKTTAHLFESLNSYIVQSHPYDVPEVIALDIEQANPQYLQWINEVVVSKP